MSVDKFWSNDIEILYRGDKLAEFFPNKEMTMSEILNSLVRASFYLSTFLFVLKRNFNMYFIFIGTVLLTYAVHTFGEKKEPFFPEMDRILKPKKAVYPTKNNPFMNTLLTDYETNPNRFVPENITEDEYLKQDIENKFNHNLYQDVGDIWNKNNSQNRFYTMPNTSIPNKQKDFAQWLYNRGPTCKEQNGYQCYANLYNPLGMRNTHPHKKISTPS